MNSINTIDQELLLFFNGNNSLFFDGIFATLTSGTTWLPLYIMLIYIVIRNNDSMGQIMLVVGASLLCVILAGGFNDTIIKPLVARLRPCNDSQIMFSLHLLKGHIPSSYSFFSSHSANTFAIAIFFCWLVRDKLLSLTLVLWALVNVYSRLYLGVHYPSDILVGFLWGTFVATMVYFLFNYFYKRITTNARLISEEYTSTGYQKSDSLIITITFVLTIIYSVFTTII